MSNTESQSVIRSFMLAVPAEWVFSRKFTKPDGEEIITERFDFLSGVYADSGIRETMMLRLIRHGLAQKCGDKCANIKRIALVKGIVGKTADGIRKGIWDLRKNLLVTEDSGSGSRITQWQKDGLRLFGEKLVAVFSKTKGKRPTEKKAASVWDSEYAAFALKALETKLFKEKVDEYHEELERQRAAARAKAAEMASEETEALDPELAALLGIEVSEDSEDSEDSEEDSEE